MRGQITVVLRNVSINQLKYTVSTHNLIPHVERCKMKLAKLLECNFGELNTLARNNSLISGEYQHKDLMLYVAVNNINQSSRDSLKIIECLLAQGADPLAKIFGVTPLEILFRKKKPNDNLYGLIHKFIEYAKRSDRIWPDKLIVSAISYATSVQNISLLMLLVKNGKFTFSLEWLLHAVKVHYSYLNRPETHNTIPKSFADSEIFHLFLKQYANEMTMVLKDCCGDLNNLIDICIQKEKKLFKNYNESAIFSEKMDLFKFYKSMHASNFKYKSWLSLNNFLEIFVEQKDGKALYIFMLMGFDPFKNGIQQVLSKSRKKIAVTAISKDGSTEFVKRIARPEMKLDKSIIMAILLHMYSGLNYFLYRF